MFWKGRLAEKGRLVEEPFFAQELLVEVLELPMLGGERRIDRSEGAQARAMFMA